MDFNIKIIFLEIHRDMQIFFDKFRNILYFKIHSAYKYEIIDIIISNKV